MIRLFAILLLTFAVGSARAQGFETSARAAWVYDVTSGTVLMARNADQPLPPASMSKLMTLYLAFEAVANGRLAADEELLVSEHAASYGGSSMFLRAGERVRVDDLLRGTIVLSGNDSAAVLAEALSPDGSEAGFARMATERARELGLTNSHFVNSNGWPAEGQVMSVQDLGRLAEHIIHDYPTFYSIFAEQEFVFDGRVPANSQNRNPILGLNIGADGLKTGHTSEAGYCLVGSAKQGDRRIIFVIAGLDTPEARREESERILTWAFRQFAERDLAPAGSQLAEADVWGGAAARVGLILPDNLTVLMPMTGPQTVAADVEFAEPVEAPISRGQQLGTLVIGRDGLPEVRVPLVAEADVERGGFTSRLKVAALVLLARVAPQAAAELEPAFAAPEAGATADGA